MDLGYLGRALARIAVSVLCGGVFYFVWMGAFLLARGLDSSALEAVLWLLAPVVTAVGYATGIVIFQRLTKATRADFFRILIWPLLGCAIGAGVVYWFGPMLIVFGMFVAGTVSIAVREVVVFLGRVRS